MDERAKGPHASQRWGRWPRWRAAPFDATLETANRLSRTCAGFRENRPTDGRPIETAGLTGTSGLRRGHVGSHDVRDFLIVHLAACTEASLRF